MHIYILTIEPSWGQRRKHCSNLLRKIGHNFTFVEGVRGDNREANDIYSKSKNFFFYKRELSPAEISCYFGFRKIWRLFLESEDDICLILEDDFNITNTEQLKKILNHAHDNSTWDILKLFDYKTKQILRKEKWHGLDIVDYKYPASGCVAYLLTRGAAHKLLTRKRIFRPVDEDLSFGWELNIRVRSIFPNPIDEVSESIGGSTIENARVSQKKKTFLIRSIWGVALQVWKQIRAYFYREYRK